eukprot:scaffold269980_cov166-Cyclotella_meneghiniana.AAC.1
MVKACREGDIDMVRRMLNFGYSLEQVAQGPFFMALKCGQIEIVTLFREMGVEIDLNMGDNDADKFKAIAEELKEEDEDNSLAEDE